MVGDGWTQEDGAGTLSFHIFSAENRDVSKIDPNDPHHPTQQLPSSKEGHFMARINSNRGFIADGFNKVFNIYNRHIN